MISRRRDCRPRSTQTFYDFVRCEYIENTSNAYIDTLIKGSNKISIQLKYIFKKNSESTSSGFIFGSRVANNDRQYGIINSYNSQFRFGNTASSDAFITDTDILVTLDNTEKHYEMKILDSSNNLLHTLTTPDSTFSNNYNLYIFGVNNSNTLDPFVDTTKLYSCKIYDEDELVRDYIPMYRKSTKEYGLWDRVEEKFYTSPNGVKFTGGERVIADADDNIYYLKDYVVAIGYYSFADTGIKGNSSDLLKMSLMVTSRPSTSYCWLIGYSVSEANRFGIYLRNTGSGYKWCVDFWRGGIGNSRRASTIVPSLNKKYNIVVGNDTLDRSNVGFLYEELDDTYIFPKYQSIDTTSSNATYIVSENRSTKADYYVRWYNLEIYKTMRGKKELVLHWIPVQRCSDGVWGFFDKVKEDFHSSEGTEQFTGA